MNFFWKILIGKVEDINKNEMEDLKEYFNRKVCIFFGLVL